MVESNGLHGSQGLPRKTVSVLVSLLLLFAPINFVFAAQTFSYDANGNMVSDGVYCYEYNDANQLSRVRDCASNQIIAEYFYDHVGKRAVKKQYENGVLQHTTYYIGDLFETKLYPDGSTENTSYYFVNGERVARKDPDGSMHYYHGDHLGSTSVVTDSAGNLEEKTKYYPYGLVRAGGTESKYLFTGQEKDAETGLYYYGARYYNPEIMRFAQPDPLLPDVYDPQSLNRYSYVRNNPLKYVDPSGNHPALLAYACALLASPDLAQDLAWVGTDIISGDYEAAAYGLVGLGIPLVGAGATSKIGKSTVGKGLRWGKSKIDDALRGLGSKIDGVLGKGGGRFTVPKGLKPTARGRFVEGRMLDILGYERYKGSSLRSVVNGKVVNFKPDYLDTSKKVMGEIVGEVKDVKYLSATKQIRAQIAYAKKYGYTYKLHVTPDTKVSEPLLRLLKEKGFGEPIRDVVYTVE